MTRTRPDQDSLVFSRVLEERTNVCIMKLGEADKQVSKAKSAIDGLRKDKNQLNQGAQVCESVYYWDLHQTGTFHYKKNSFPKQDTMEAVKNTTGEIERSEKAIARWQQDTEQLSDKERVCVLFVCLFVFSFAVC